MRILRRVRRATTAYTFWRPRKDGEMTDTPAHAPLAQRLRAVLDEVPHDGITAHRLMARLGADAVWLALLMLGAAALIPSPGVPLGVLSGGAIVLVAAHLMSGARDLPGPVARRRVPRRSLAALLPHLARWVERAEGALRPRLRALSAPGTVRLWALAILLQGILIALPIPLGNPLPGIAVAVLALGLMRRDGAALLAGLVCCALATAWAVGVVALGAEITSRILA
jgi:hypothetical protein